MNVQDLDLFKELADSLDAEMDALEAEIIEASGKDKTRIFSASVRAEVWARDGFYLDGSALCYLCGGLVFPNEPHHMDHVIPHVLGGRSVAANAKITHPRCNLKKSKRVW